MKQETIIMGHKLRFRTWTWGMKQQALRESTTWTTVNGELVPDIDPWRLNDQMLIQTLIQWDLKDGEGKHLPITVETIHSLRPELVEAMIAYTQKLNGVTQEERKKSTRQ
jgi:hypothetical protein